MPKAPPIFMATSRPVYHPNGSKDKYSGQKTGKDKAQWDPIPITYIELLPKLIESGFIEPFYLAPLRALFSRWYNANVRCDYHAGNPSHSTKNCIALNRTVQSLINDGKLNFEKSNGPAGIEDPYRTEVGITRQEAPMEASFGKASMPGDKVPIVKTEGNEKGCLLATEGSKERSRKPNGEKEKKVL